MEKTNAEIRKDKECMEEGRRRLEKDRAQKEREREKNISKTERRMQDSDSQIGEGMREEDDRFNTEAPVSKKDSLPARASSEGGRGRAGGREGVPCRA